MSTTTVGGALRAAVEAVHAPTVTFSWVTCEARVLRTVVAVDDRSPLEDAAKWLDMADAVDRAGRAPIAPPDDRPASLYHAAVDGGVRVVWVEKPDWKAEALAIVARLTAGDVRCVHCGGDAAAGWTVCYACCHLPEGDRV